MIIILGILVFALIATALGIGYMMYQKNQPKNLGDDCTTNEQCNEGLRCFQQKCNPLPKDLGGDCTANDHCKSGLSCFQQKCSPSYTDHVGHGCYWGEHPDTAWNYVDAAGNVIAEETPVTADQCKSACNNTPTCTSFEHFPGTTNVPDPYCALWYGNACNDSTSLGWGDYSSMEDWSTVGTYTKNPSPTA